MIYTLEDLTEVVESNSDGDDDDEEENVAKEEEGGDEQPHIDIYDDEKEGQQ